MLELIDKALDQMPFAVEPSVVCPSLLAALMRRNDSNCTLSHNRIEERLGSITTVSNHIVTGKVCEQRICLCDVMALSCREAQAQWIAQRIYRNMDFGAKATTTAA